MLLLMLHTAMLLLPLSLGANKLLFLSPAFSNLGFLSGIVAVAKG